MPPASLRDAILIGIMVGLERFLGRSAQAIINAVGRSMGEEVWRFVEREGRAPRDLDDLRDLLVGEGFAGEIEFDVTDEGEVSATVEDCRICPKRVGGHRFEGTACPWGGMLSYMVGRILGREFSFQARLTPGERCSLTLRPKSPRGRG